jgi:hypothetical protein
MACCVGFFGFKGHQKKESLYPKLGEPVTILKGETGKWDETNTHTLSIVEVNKDGYKYWGYYGVDRYCEAPERRKCGLIRSNNLIDWERYPESPIINSNCRWPTAVVTKGETDLFYAEYNSECDSRIVTVNSKDGIHFGEKEEVVPYVKGRQNQNPFIFRNPKDKKFYLFYYSGRERGDSTDNEWSIMVRSAKDIKDLKNAKSKTLMSDKTIIAAPSVAYYKGKFLLAIEALNPKKWGDKWVTLAYESDSPDKGYKEVSNSLILKDDQACAFQYVFHNELYVSLSHCVNAAKENWELQIVKAKK